MNLSTFELFKNLKVSEYGVPVEGDILKKCQAVILSIAEDVISVCEEEHIWYELGGGTALGAIRHQGFIPWDDDVDINILRKDLNILGEKIKTRFGDKYEYLTYSSPDYGLPMGKVMLKKSVYRDRESFGSDNCGFFIDLFPVVNVSNNQLLRKIHGKVCMIAGGLLSCRKFYKNRKLYFDIAKDDSEAIKAVKTKVKIGRMTAFMSVQKWATLTDWIYNLCKDYNSKQVSIPSGRKHYFGSIYDRDTLLTTSGASFEGHTWQVVKNYDVYFKNLYGTNYMTVPPENKREHHVLLELRFPGE